jgi:hypothetical protein
VGTVRVSPRASSGASSRRSSRPDRLGRRCGAASSVALGRGQQQSKEQPTTPERRARLGPWARRHSSNVADSTDSRRDRRGIALSVDRHGSGISTSPSESAATCRTVTSTFSPAEYPNPTGCRITQDPHVELTAHFDSRPHRLTEKGRSRAQSRDRTRSDRSQLFTTGHTRSQVELLLASLDTPPQVNSLLGRLSSPITRGGDVSGPTRCSNSAGNFTIEDTSCRVPRPLRQRLSPEQRAALGTAHADVRRRSNLQPNMASASAASNS